MSTELTRDEREAAEVRSERVRAYLTRSIKGISNDEAFLEENFKAETQTIQMTVEKFLRLRNFKRSDNSEPWSYDQANVFVTNLLNGVPTPPMLTVNGKLVDGQRRKRAIQIMLRKIKNSRMFDAQVAYGRLKNIQISVVETKIEGAGAEQKLWDVINQGAPKVL